MCGETVEDGSHEREEIGSRDGREDALHVRGLQDEKVARHWRRDGTELRIL
jgi:hypothetical protein